MAFYGVPTAGVLTASTSDDTVVLGVGQSSISASTVIANDGNDIINLGAQGYTATGAAGFNASIQLGISAKGVTTGVVTYSGSIQASSLVTFGGVVTGRAIASGVTTFSGSTTTGVVVTSQQAVRDLSNAYLYGNAGNDKVYLGNSFTAFSNTFIGLGAGDDIVGNITYVNSISGNSTQLAFATSQSAFVEGGGGNDSIRFVDAAGALVFRDGTVQGSQGNDVVTFDLEDGDTRNSLIAAGGNNDIVLFDSNSSTSVTVAGGGGDDVVAYSAAVSDAAFIAGDQPQAVVGTYDGNDSISGDILAGSANSIYAGAGNDTVAFALSASVSASVISLMGGNDVLSISGQFSDSTVYGGDGADSLTFETAKTAAIFGGGGNDTVTLNQQMSGAAADYSASTIWGGAGADLFLGTAIGSGGSGGSTDASMQVAFGYSAFSDSTLSAMDSIGIGAGSGETYRLIYNPGGLTRAANFTNDTNGVVSGTNGVVVFSGDAYAELTSRVNALNTNITTVGAAAIFQDAQNNTYVFVQGGSDDMLVKIGSATSAMSASMAINVSEVASVSIISAALA